jgi:hypothetical protein
VHRHVWNFIVVLTLLLCVAQGRAEHDKVQGHLCRSMDCTHEGPKIRLQILSMEEPGTLTVAINNVTRQPVRLWEESHSWGAAHWRVVRIRGERVDAFFQNPNQLFTRNIPTYVEIAPNATKKQSLNLDDGEWLSDSTDDPRLKRGDRIVIIYDVPDQEFCLAGFDEARKFRVWHGIATTSEVFGSP